jgi:hypothetical protein
MIRVKMSQSGAEDAISVEKSKTLPGQRTRDYTCNSDVVEKKIIILMNNKSSIFNFEPHLS